MPDTVASTPLLGFSIHVTIYERRNDQEKDDLKEAGSVARSVLEEKHKNVNEENER